MARTLVTDGEQRSTLAVVRSLGRAGHEVIVGGFRPRTLAGASRYAASRVVLPGTGEGDADYLSAVERVVQDRQIEVCLPMTDRSVSLLFGLRERCPGLRLPLPSQAAYEHASDKYRLTVTGRRLGIPVPEQVELEGPEDIQAGSLDSLGWPLILKPWSSEVHTTEGPRSLAVRPVDDLDTVRRHLATLPAEAFPVLAQRRIVGRGLGVFVLARDGELRAIFAHERLREKPPTGGVSTYRSSVPVRGDLRDYTERLIAELGWTGVAMVEFKEHRATGTAYLMEVNGRFWGSLQLAIDSGVDFPRRLMDIAMGSGDGPLDDYRTGVRSRWLWGDLDHHLWLLRRSPRQRGHFPGLPGRFAALAGLFFPWRPGDRFEVLRLTDPGPFLRETRDWIADLV